MTLAVEGAIPASMILSLGGPLLAGLIVLIWGRRMPRKADWLAGISLVGLLVGIALNWDTHVPTAGSSLAWLRGWIWPRQENGAVVIGILLDLVGLAVSTMATVVAALALVSHATVAREPRPERLFSAAAFGAFGVALAWLSLTPWLAFVGIAVAVLGGFVSLGSRWSTDVEAAMAARFGRERVWGLILMIVGACALASSGASLAWKAESAWAGGAPAMVGALLLMIGLFVQMQPFPLLGWIVMPSEVAPSARVLFSQVLPSWAAFAVMTRFDGEFRTIGIFPYFGWVAIASVVLACVSGLLQRDWRQGLGAWVSASQSAAVAALAFAGPWPGLALAVGTGIAGMALAFFGANAESEAIKGPGPAPVWSKAGAIIAALAGSGMLGFVTAGAMIRWMVSGLAVTSMVAAFALVGFFLALLLWKETWALSRHLRNPSASWFSVIPPLLALCLALGVVWTGTLTGSALPGNPDAVTRSALDGFFGAAEPEQSPFLLGSWLHWGALALAFVGAYWTSARKQDLWLRIHEGAPRLGAFICGGYGVDRLLERALAGINWSGHGIELIAGQKVWKRWIPSATRWVVHWFARPLAVADTKIATSLGSGLRRVTEVPAKVLQLIQSGDVQWYLFFAVGSSIAILIHFLRF